MIRLIFAAVPVLLAQQNYNVKEGETVNINLEMLSSDYEFDVTVTLQLMDGSATGESFYLSTQNRTICRYSHSIRFKALLVTGHVYVYHFLGYVSR